MASKSYGWDVRNKAKSGQKTVIFRFFFQFSQKLSIRFKRNFLQSFFTILWSFVCNFIKFVWLGCEKQPKLAQKWPKSVIFRFFFDFLKKCPYDSNEIFYSHSSLYYGPLCAMASKSYGWDVRNVAKISPKMAKNSDFSTFSIFSKTVHTIRTKFSTVILHHIRVLYVQWH